MPDKTMSVPDSATLGLDGRSIGTGKPGPVTLRLTGLLAELTATTGTPVA